MGRDKGENLTKRFLNVYSVYIDSSLIFSSHAPLEIQINRPYSTQQSTNFPRKPTCLRRPFFTSRPTRNTLPNQFLCLQSNYLPYYPCHANDLLNQAI